MTLLGRERICHTLEQHGLSLTHYAHAPVSLSPTQLSCSTDAAVLAAADLILVTVKSQDTAAAAQEIKARASSHAVVVSLQNGVRNKSLLRTALPEAEIYAAMVPFNVVNQGKGRFHCGTEGSLVFEAGGATAELVNQLQKAGLPASLSDNIEGVQWAKLLMNLNNALNVLADVPLQQQLQDRDYRRVLSLLIDEALTVLRVGGVKPVRVGKIWPSLLPHALRLPNVLFSILARGMLRMDPEARSSMWEDLQHRRAPEIDWLNGEVIRLGRELGVPTPVNEIVVSEVKQAFKNSASPGYTGEALLKIITG